MIFIEAAVTVIISVLLASLAFTIKANIQLQKEINVERHASAKAEQALAVCEEERRSLEKQLAFRDGLQTGRKSDALYRQLVKKFTDGERFTVMMNGEKEGDGE